MRKSAKRFLITSEEHEVVTIRRRRDEALHAFCPECAADVEVLSFDAAIHFSGKSGRALIRSIESSSVHAMELSANYFGVCRRSLELEKKHVREDAE